MLCKSRFLYWLATGFWLINRNRPMILPTIFSIEFDCQTVCLDNKKKKKKMKIVWNPYNIFLARLLFLNGGVYTPDRLLKGSLPISMKGQCRVIFPGRSKSGAIFTQNVTLGGRPNSRIKNIRSFGSYTYFVVQYYYYSLTNTLNVHVCTCVRAFVFYFRLGQFFSGTVAYFAEGRRRSRGLRGWEDGTSYYATAIRKSNNFRFWVRFFFFTETYSRRVCSLNLQRQHNTLGAVIM